MAKKTAATKRKTVRRATRAHQAPPAAVAADHDQAQPAAADERPHNLPAEALLPAVLTKPTDGENQP